MAVQKLLLQLHIGVQWNYHVFQVRIFRNPFVLNLLTLLLVCTELFEHVLLDVFNTAFRFSGTFGLQSCLLLVLQPRQLSRKLLDVKYCIAQSILLLCFRLPFQFQNLLLTLCLAHGENTDCQLRSIELLLFNSIVVLQLSSEQYEKLLIEFVKDFFDFLSKFAVLCLELLDGSLLLLFSLLLLDFVFLQLHLLVF